MADELRAAHQSAERRIEFASLALVEGEGRARHTDRARRRNIAAAGSYLLYNQITGRTNGTTPSFFATMTVRPPNIIDRPHRHASAAINYYFSGAGYSRVGGQALRMGSWRSDALRAGLGDPQSRLARSGPGL